MKLRHCVIAFTFLALTFQSAPAAETSEPVTASATTETFTVNSGPFTDDLELAGFFEASVMTPVSLAPKEWQPMKVVWAAAPGAIVNNGDLIAKLDSTDLDKKISDAESGFPLQDLALKQAREELRILEKTAPERLAREQRSKKIINEDFQQYIKADYPYKAKELALDKKGNDVWLDSAKLEMNELKKMYEADDLIETTEELVLKRQDINMDRTLIGYEKNTKYLFPWRESMEAPRELQERKQTLLDAENNLDRIQTMLPIELTRKGMEVAKMENDMANAKRTLQALKADRDSMTIRAPVAGVLYYGECVRGSWPSAVTMAAKLRPGGSLSAHEIFMTIVDISKMFLTANAAEKDLCDLKTNLPVEITPTADPKHKFNGKVEALTIMPGAPAPYTVKISFDGKNRSLLPGMTATAKIRVYDNADALIVPDSAVFAEETDTEKRYVYLAGEKGVTVKRDVVVGREKGSKLEIVEGLSAGDTILTNKPGK